MCIGNVQTRLAKIDSGAYEALILAAAGRGLNLGVHIQHYLDPFAWILPRRSGSHWRGNVWSCATDVKSLLLGLHDPDTADCVQAERSVSAGLGGSCILPLAAHLFRGGIA